MEFTGYAHFVCMVSITVLTCVLPTSADIVISEMPFRDSSSAEAHFKQIRHARDVMDSMHRDLTECISATQVVALAVGDQVRFLDHYLSRLEGPTKGTANMAMPLPSTASGDQSLRGDVRPQGT